MTPVTVPVADLLPHAGRMRLLDRAIEGDAEHLVAEVDIRPDGLFFDGTGVGGWVGIEYMAQAIAAWAGLKARAGGGTPRIGFLLGSRRYRCEVAHFLPGQTLRVRIRCDYLADNGLGQFDCRIDIDGTPVATAALTVYEPADPAALLQRAAHDRQDTPT